MRVITGVARGKRLETLPGNDIVRPTSDRVKEGIFSAIQFDIEGRRILDLFAGSGQLGIEALSRGAESATFVDLSQQSIDVVRRNLKNTGLLEKARVIRSDFVSFAASCKETFDIAFLDPPYEAGYLEKAVTAISPIMSDYGIIICEHPKDVSLPEVIADFEACRSYRYSHVSVELYRRRKSDA